MIRYWILSLLCTLSYQMLSAQAADLSSKSVSLTEIFQRIERTSGLKINYDADRLSKYSAQLPRDVTDVSTALKEILRPTPYTYELTDDFILILDPGPQRYQICGAVLTEEGHQSLSYVNVSISGTNKGLETDEQGKFNFTVDAAKNEELVISYIGFISQTLLADDFSDGKCKDIYLVPDLEILGSEIVISDYIIQGITEGKRYSSTEINLDLVENLTSFQEHDVLKTVQLLPGIQSTDESASRLSIRGSTPDQNLILWENVSIYDPGHLYGSISGINPFIVDEVKVYKGVYHPKYESRVGGVIDISMNDEISSRISGGVGSTLSEAHLYLDVPLYADRASITIAGRHSINQLYNSQLLENYTKKLFQKSAVDIDEMNRLDFDVFDQSLTYFDLSSKLKIKLSDKIKLTTSLLKSKNQYDYQTTYSYLDEITDAGEEVFVALDERDQQDFDNVALSSKLHFDWSPYLETTMYVAQSDYQFMNEYRSTFAEDEINFIQLNNQVKDLQFGVMNHWTDQNSVEFDFGYSFESKDVSLLFNNGFLGSEFDDILSGRFHNIVTSISYFKNGLSISGGMRVSYYEADEKNYFSPRINIQYSVAPGLKLKASTGKFYQFIRQVENLELGYINVLDAYWVLNDPEEEKQLNINKYTLGGVYSQHGWLIDVEAYCHQVNNLSSLSSTFNSEVFFYDFGTSQAKGVDVLLKKSWSNFNSWINYSYSSNQFSFPTLSTDFFPANNDQTHSVNWINSLQLSDWTFTTSYQYKTGLPYSLPLLGDLIEVDNGDNPLFYFEYDFDAYNNLRLPDYSRLNMSIAYKHAFYNGSTNAEISLSVINVLNRENIFSRRYNQNYIFSPTAEADILVVDKELIKRSAQLMLRLEF